MVYDIQKIAPLIYFTTMSLCRTDITPGQISLWIFLNLVGWKTGVDCNKIIKHVLYTCTTKQICRLQRSKKCLKHPVIHVFAYLSSGLTPYFFLVLINNSWPTPIGFFTLCTKKKSHQSRQFTALFFKIHVKLESFALFSSLVENDKYSEIKTSRLIKACAILVMGSR